MAGLMKKANFKMKAYLSDKFNERRCYIYFKKRGQGDVLSNYKEEIPLKIDLKVMCFMSNKPQHMRESYLKHVNMLDLRSVIFFCF
jgi:hypothetical protein